MPDSIGEELTRAEQSFFVLYQDQEGNIVYDTNIFYYNSIDQNRTLSVAVAKAEESSDAFHEDVKQSKIGGVSLILAASSNGNGCTAYRADFKLKGVSVQMISDGLNENEFIRAISEFIRLLK